jgi:hypothetical protein
LPALRVNLGSPTRPSNALNYEASTDMIPFIGATLGGDRSGEAITIPMPGHSTLEAHSFMSIGYQWALYDAMHNKGAIHD